MCALVTGVQTCALPISTGKSDMSIGQFFAILWARRAFVFVTTAAALLGAAFVVLLLPPRYEAKSCVMLNFIKPDPVTGEVISSSFARTYTKTQRSEEHTSELQSLVRISYAVFCLKKKKKII